MPILRSQHQAELPGRSSLTFPLLAIYGSWAARHNGVPGPAPAPDDPAVASYWAVRRRKGIPRTVRPAITSRSRQQPEGQQELRARAQSAALYWV
jgi:hypothetical protein